MAKTKVILCSKEGKTLEHTLEHAEALLKYQAEKGFNDWSIAKDQPYKFKDGIIVSTNKRANSETEAQNGDSAGDSK